MLFNRRSLTNLSAKYRVHRPAALLATLMLMLFAPSQTTWAFLPTSSETLMAGEADENDLISAMLNNYVPNDLRSVINLNEVGSGSTTVVDPVSPDTSGVPLCTDTLYGANTAGVLHTININTAVATLVGTMPTSPSTEIEYDPATGRAFSQTGGFEFNGHEFDIVNASGIGTFIPNAHTYTGLEWVGSTLYGASINGPQQASTLRILDPWTGTNTTIGLTGFGPLSGLAYHAASGIMYGIEGGGGRE
jgi:hypothetical protein